MLLKTELSYWIGSIHQWQSICVRKLFPKILGRTFLSIKNSHKKQFLPNHSDPAQCNCQQCAEELPDLSHSYPVHPRLPEATHL